VALICRRNKQCDSGLWSRYSALAPYPNHVSSFTFHPSPLTFPSHLLFLLLFFQVQIRDAVDDPVFSGLAFEEVAKPLQDPVVVVDLIRFLTKAVVFTRIDEKDEGVSALFRRCTAFISLGNRCERDWSRPGFGTVVACMYADMTLISVCAETTDIS